MEEITDGERKLKRGKSAGIDRITGKMFKNADEIVIL